MMSFLEYFGTLFAKNNASKSVFDRGTAYLEDKNK
jgi:hypothetical protein